MSEFYVPVGTKYDKNANTPIEQKKEYSETWSEWAAKNRKQVFAFQGTGAGTANIYVVPAGFTLYVTSFNHSMSPTANANADSLIYTNLIYTSMVSYLTSRTPVAIPVTNSNSFPMPLKFNSGDTLILYSSANCVSYCCIHGFLEPNQA